MLQVNKLFMSLVGVSILCACGTPARKINSGGTELITTVGQVDIQDFNEAATKLVQSMTTSGVFAEYSSKNKAVLGISRIINDTTDQFDTDLLIKDIRVALLKSGKVTVSNTVGLGGKAEDPMAKSAKEMEEFKNGKGTEMPAMPKFTLTCKILEVRASAGNTKQSSFVFQMSLTDITTGNSKWEGEQSVTKQGSKPAIGF